MLQTFPRNLNRLLHIGSKISKAEFAIFRPAGNDTGLISGIIRNPQQRKQIADTLQKTYQNIEQVGFVSFDAKHPELVMTGGEFCGNATSCAAYHILLGQPGEILIKVSGVSKRLRAGVTKGGDGFSQMPVFSDPSYIQKDKKGNMLVQLEGITHYVDFDTNQIRGLTIEEIKNKARQAMREKGIDQQPACGIIYTEKLAYGWAIHPIVYVRDADTLYYETACGSGTTALGLVLALKNGDSIEAVPVIQPSGLTIKVCVTYDGKTFGYVQIQSHIEKLQEGIVAETVQRGVHYMHTLPMHERYTHDAFSKAFKKRLKSLYHLNLNLPH